MDQNSKQILHLTLEIIYLLTGEDYIIMKRSGEFVTPISKTQSLLMVAPTLSVRPEKHSERKILELTRKITELLVGEGSLEGYKDMSDGWTLSPPGEDQIEILAEESQTFTTGPASPGRVRHHQRPDDKGGGKTTTSKIHTLEASVVAEPGKEFHVCTSEERATQSSHMEEVPHSSERGSLPPSVYSSRDRTHHPPLIEDTPLSCEGRNLPDSVYTSLPSSVVDRIPESCQGRSLQNYKEPNTCQGDFPNPSTYSFRDHTPHKAMLIKEEPCSREDSNHSASSTSEEHRWSLTEGKVYTSGQYTPYTTPYVKEEPNFLESEITVTRIKDEPSSADEEMFITYVKEEPHPCEEYEQIDTDNGTLIDHLQDDYGYGKEDSSSCSEENLSGADNYLSADYAEYKMESDLRGDGINVPPDMEEPSESNRNTYTPPDIAGPALHSADSSEADGDHVKTSTDEMDNFMSNVYSCLFCQRRFGSFLELSKHEKIHSAEDPTVCSECGKSFDTHSLLLAHQKLHFGERPWTCSDCGKGFFRKSRLVIHQRRHTGERPYTCTECGKSFSCKAHLVAHEKIHTGVKPFQCGQCGKAFIRRPDLVIHERTHTGEKPFRCSECGKSFVCNSHLASHQKMHAERRRLTCGECGKYLRSDFLLQEHARVHSTGKPYSSSELSYQPERFAAGQERFQCPDCGKPFTSKTACAAHQRIHSGKKLWDCMECGKVFVNQSHLALHLRYHS
ncbi:zinc finger protein 3 homolog isoform X2 [Hyperolius riggenbachi]